MVFQASEALCSELAAQIKMKEESLRKLGGSAAQSSLQPLHVAPYRASAAMREVRSPFDRPIRLALPRCSGCMQQLGPAPDAHGSWTTSAQVQTFALRYMRKVQCVLSLVNHRLRAAAVERHLLLSLRSDLGARPIRDGYTWLVWEQGAPADV